MHMFFRFRKVVKRDHKLGFVNLVLDIIKKKDLKYT